MARNTEYLTGNRYIRYPFSDDAVTTADEDLSRLLFGCFTDALVQSKHGTVSPKVTDITVSGHTLGFSLACDEHPDSTIRLSCTHSPTRFPVISGQSDWCWYTFVMSSDGIRELEAYDAQDWSGTSLALSDRCVGIDTPGVTELLVYDGAKTIDGRRLTWQEAVHSEDFTYVTGDVMLKPGYNMALEFDGSNGVSLNARPGAGDGVAPCWCTSDKDKFKTPGLLGNDGHVRLFNDTCYDIIPYKSDDVGMLSAHVKCKACCTCDMYASIVNDRLIPLRNDILKDRKTVNDAYGLYEENVLKWNERIATAMPEDIVITSTGTPLDANGTNLNIMSHIKGKMDRCGFSLIMRNDSFVKVTMVLDSFISNGSPFEAQVSYMKDGETPAIEQVDLSSKSKPLFRIDLEAGRSAVLTYSVRLRNMVHTDHQNGFMSKVQVSAYQGIRLIVTRDEVIGI